MDIIKKISEELEVKSGQVQAAVELLDEGCTVPFIARYRKEKTGALNDEQLRKLNERLTYLRNLEEKKQTVITSIQEQEKMTPELMKEIEACETLVALEDLYRPYRPKRRTRATIAKEAGLEPLAEIIMAQETKKSMEEEAAPFINEEKGITTVDEAIQGASDIIAEQISDTADYRTWIREKTFKLGKMLSTAKDPEAKSVYENYYEFDEPLNKITGYRTLALNRGEKEKFLTVKIDAPVIDVVNYLERQLVKKEILPRLKSIGGISFQEDTNVSEKKFDKFDKKKKNDRNKYSNSGIDGLEEAAMLLGLAGNDKKNDKKRDDRRNRQDAKNAPEKEEKRAEEYLLNTGKPGETEIPWTSQVIVNAIVDAYDRLIAPAIEREIRNELTETAEDGAIEVFGKNLTQLLMQPPIAGQTVLGWDPAFRTGCKLAVVDPTGKVLDTTVIYPTAPTTDEKIAKAKATLKKMIKKYGITLISCGNGTASRESEQIIVELLHEIDDKVSYVITNEAGASVYSASALATEEFPEFDVGQRSATSIARRVQDPLAELVKIDPKSIGVGQYQHDMNQKKLGEALGGVVETAVNKVGVDLNTASAPLLQYVSGISKPIAKNIVAYREENGSFTDRKELLKVPKLGAKAFEQCAGFLRISGGKNPLDATAVHPESYEATQKLLDTLGITLDKQVLTEMGKDAASKLKALSDSDKKKLSEDIGIGEMTLSDIIDELLRPGRDPREDMPKPILRSDVLDMKDLEEGMVLKGTVRNVIDFGAFVDIGVHQDGLVHISQITNKKFIKHPLEVVSVGDIVEVKVISVDKEKGRIGLSMIL
ncbi:S1 RNA binding domain-containing protein [Lachnospiraceae bacterium NE2001]|nr:S1 RNA binding domain-containing protein [Lachnospiraceae bacterium NE2001]